MRALKLIVPAALLTAGFMICTTASYGKPEYMKKEGVSPAPSAIPRWKRRI